MKESMVERNERILRGGPWRKPRTVYVWINQHGAKYYASTLKELKAQVGGSVRKMYRYINHDTSESTSECIGYVIGQLWFTRYVIAPIKERACTHSK